MDKNLPNPVTLFTVNSSLPKYFPVAPKVLFRIAFGKTAKFDKNAKDDRHQGCQMAYIFSNQKSQFG
jgi:hypothetical protein